MTTSPKSKSSVDGTARNRALLDRVLARVPERERIAARPASAPIVASHQQRQLWVLEQGHGSGPYPYNQSASIWLRGPLDPAALERALAALHCRHAALRTRFTLDGGELIASVDPQPPRLVLGCADHSQLAGAIDRTAVLERVAHDEARRRFDLARGPLFRAQLLRFAADEHALVLTWHHIAIDGLSLGIVVGELAVLYGQVVEGRGELAAPALQYTDFAAYQHERLKDERLARELVYWRAELAGELPVLELPLDRPRPASRGHRGARQAVTLPAATIDAIAQLARNRGATPFMVLLAAYAVLLHRYTGQRELLIGVPYAGRNHPDTANLVGCFINPLAVRCRIDSAAGYRQLLDEVRDATQRAIAHQELPFEQLVSALGAPRDPGHNPVFQTLFGMQGRVPHHRAGGLAFESVAMHNAGTAKFDLEMSLFEDAASLTVCIDHDIDLLDPATALRMLRHYTAIVEAVCRDPDQKIGRVAMMTREERAQIVGGWNATGAAYPEDRCVHELVAEQAARTPERIAVVEDEQRLTYRALEERANQLGHYLRGLGIGPGAIVALLVERSLELPVALLGVLKAGAAYLPLDASAPGERLGLMLRDAGAVAVVAHDHLVARLPASEVRVVRLGADGAAIGRGSTLAVGGGARPEDLMYVMYTSGSTGQPKGVMLEHRGVTSRVVDMQRAYVGAEEVVLHKTPYTFDVAVNELLCPLIVGARVVMARPDGHRDPGYLVRAIEAHGVTLVEMVPSMLQVMLGEAEVGRRCRTLRTVIASGEALAPGLADEVTERLGAELYNVYGPTEAGEVTVWHCARGVERPTPSVPLGRPMANLQIYVLDESGEPVAVGVRGELYIGGVGVARGYLGKPALTAARFVPDAFGGAGRRLYRTGDVARYTAEGVIEYLGRRDDQVKIRGYRVEPGEIEAVLRRQGGVREAVVVVREDRAGDRRLVAYVVGNGDAVRPEDLRAGVQAALPEPMVPSAFVVVDALPFSAHGKVDRRALPAPDVTGSATADDAPPTETEQRLLAIWSEVLDVPDLAATDDLFELGANSLLMVQGASRIRQEFGVELEQDELFERPTVREQGARLDATLARAATLVASIPVTEDRVQAARAILADPSSSPAARMGAQNFLEAVGRDHA
jgi:amino acid adenylation domain-containing protein